MLIHIALYVISEGQNSGQKKQNNKFTVLTTDEAEVIVQELGKALDSHREWSGIFRTMLVCRTKPEATELDPHSFKNSNFAKWYYQNDNNICKNILVLPLLAKTMKLYTSCP